MADPVSDAYSQLLSILDEVEEIGILAQLGISLGLTLVALLFTRYFARRVAWRLVKRTEAEWDNELLAPIFNRLYIFVLIAGLDLTMMWTLGRRDGIYIEI